MHRSVKNDFHSKHARNGLRRGIFELTNGASIYGVAVRVGDFKFCINERAYIGDITRIEGMRIWLARVQRGRPRPKEEAENREDEDDTHVGKAGGNENAQSRDEAIIRPVS
jgi:hypothetical protein